MNNSLMTLSNALSGLSAIQAQALHLDAGSVAASETFLTTLDPNEAIFIARLPQGSFNRHFISRDGRSFHELAITSSVDQDEKRSSIVPILTQTPGFLSMALVYDGLGLRLAYNHSEDRARLEILSCSLRCTPDWLSGATFFAPPAGDAPALEGALAGYWSQLTDPDKPMVDSISLPTFLQFVRGTAHTLNNASEVLTNNGDFFELTLEALHALTSLLASSPELEAAFRKAMAGHPHRDEVEGLIDDLRQNLPREAQNTGSLFGLLAATAKDLQQISGDFRHGTKRIVAFTHGLQRMYQKAEDPTLILDPIHGLREAEAQSKILRPKAPALEEASVSVVTAPVLMVEDDIDLADMTAEALRREGFSNLLTATSLQDALDAFERNPGIQLVFTDYNLSDTETGLDLVRLLKEMSPDLKVVFVTGNEGALKEQMTLVERTVYEFFSKPVEMSAVAERLRKLLAAND